MTSTVTVFKRLMIAMTMTNTDSNLLDGDCDGVLTADDCDDNDSGSTTVATDADCDGIQTNNDCDDSDPTSTMISNDLDCDGVIGTFDCDDEDPNLLDIGNDFDCDGIETGDDCDDDDNTLGAILTDADCDGIETGIDCDDTQSDIGGDCSVCYDYFNLTSELVASNSVNTLPYAEGTTSRILHGSAACSGTLYKPI